MPHKIIYSDRGVDLRKFLLNTYHSEWDPPFERGYFSQSHQNMANFGHGSNRYFANTNEPYTVFNGHLSFTHIPWLQKGDLSGDETYLGFVIEAPEGKVLESAYKHYRVNYYGEIAKVTVGWGVEALSDTKFIVRKPILTFVFEELEATGDGSLGHGLIHAFNRGNFNQLFENNTDNTMQIGGPGNDTMYGFKGTDTFVFQDKNPGKDAIRNFEADDDHNDHDLIVISTEIFPSYADMQPHISMRETSTVIRIDDKNEIVLLHVNQHHIGEGDFKFLTPAQLKVQEMLPARERHIRATDAESFEYRVDTPYAVDDTAASAVTYSFHEMQPA